MKGLVGPLVGGGPGARAPWAPLNPALIDAVVQSTLGARHFCPKIHVWKINKMPEFYSIFARKILFSWFFWGGTNVPLPLYASHRLIHLWAKGAATFQNWGCRSFLLSFCPHKRPTTAVDRQRRPGERNGEGVRRVPLPNRLGAWMSVV